MFPQNPLFWGLLAVGVVMVLNVVLSILTSPWFWFTAIIGVAGFLWFRFRRQ